MRYLFFTYVARGGGRVSNGNIWGEWPQFPSNAELKGVAEERNPWPGMTVVLTGWDEFKTEADFKSFTKDKKALTRNE